MDLLIRIFAAVAGAALTGLIWYLVGKDVRKPAAEGVLSYGPSIKLIGAAGATIFLGAGYFTFMYQGKMDLLSLMIFVVLVLMCVALLLEAGFVRIRYNDRGICTSSPWRPSREIPWHSIAGYQWSQINMWHVLETRGYGSIRLSMYLRGLHDFFRELEKHTGKAFGPRLSAQD